MFLHVELAFQQKLAHFGYMAAYSALLLFTSSIRKATNCDAFLPDPFEILRRKDVLSIHHQHQSEMRHTFTPT